MEAKTRVTFPIGSPEDSGKSWQIELADDFDTVFNKCYPLTPPTSQLEHRYNCTFTLAEGGRCSFNPNAAFLIEEIT